MASPPKVSWLSLSDCQTTVTLNDQRFGSERAADESEPSRSFLVQGDMNGATQHVKTTRPFSFETPNGPSKFMLEEQLSLRSSRKTQVSPSPPSLRSRFYTTPPTSILTKASYSPVPDDKLPSLSSSESQSSAQEIDESPVIPSSDLIPDGSLPPLPLQLPPTPFENALNCPMIPVSPLQGPLYDPVMHNPEYSLYGTPSVRFASTSHPRYLDGLIPVTNSEHTSLSGTAGRLSSWERLLFERVVKYSRSYSSFKTKGLNQAWLRVYKSPLTKDLRFSLVSKGSRELEYSFEVPHNSCELVLAYAYETTWPEMMVYLQKRSGHDAKDWLPPESRKIIWICQFTSIDDLADFQSRVIGEDILLDISSVRTARVKTRKTEISSPGCRVQIWHERRRNSHESASDKVSYISNDTVLSGPTKEKTRPRSDRLLIFFNRLEEFLSVSITDEIEMKQASHVSVVIKARKYAGRNIWRSRSSIKGYYARRTSHAAGFPLGLGVGQPDDGKRYEKLESIVIEFESQRELITFTEIWRQSLDWRREQRRVLRSIQEEMEHEQFTGKDARRIWFHSG